MIRLYVSQAELADNARFILSRLFLTVKANLRGVINERGFRLLSKTLPLSNMLLVAHHSGIRLRGGHRG